MGNSGSPKPNGKHKSAIDSSVGALVWVRRRNGSWWPGQIMGLDEFSDHSLVSPAAGTPVKLLGRQDPTIDWYNLEKSKRVKAFRCGEYDECIEKARASASNSNRRTVRYARREDAILDALEIERIGLSNKCLSASPSNGFCAENVVFGKEKHRISIGYSQGFSSDGEEEESDSCRNGLVLISGLDSGTDLHHYVLDNGPQLSESGVSFEEPIIFGDSKVEMISDMKSRKTSNDSEDDGTEGVMRLKGLEDLGLGVKCPKTGNCASNGSTVNRSKTCTLSLRRKRTHVGDAHELLKRKHRRRQLTKVLESTVMLSAQSDCYKLSPHEVMSESKLSGVESIDSKKDSSLPISNNSDSTGISYENGSTSNVFEMPQCSTHAIDEEPQGNDGFGWSGTKEKLFNDLYETKAKGTTVSTCNFHDDEIRVLDTKCFHVNQTEATPSKNETVKDFATVSEAKAYGSHSCHKLDRGTSRWQSKGKRNLRRKSRSRRREHRKYADLNGKTCSLSEKENLGRIVSGSIKKSAAESDQSKTSYCCSTTQARAKLLACSSAHSNHGCQKLCLKEESHIYETAASDLAVTPKVLKTLPYRQSRSMVNSRYQSSYLLGKNFHGRAKLYNVKQEVISVRPLADVPLRSLRSKFSNKTITGFPITIVVLDDGYCDRMMHDILHDLDDGRSPNAKDDAQDGKGQRSSKTKQGNSHNLGSKSSKHLRNGLSSKKIRKLSSLTGSRSCIRKPTDEKAKCQATSCIPVKVVFSRIHEAVNRSGKQTQGLCSD